MVIVLRHRDWFFGTGEMIGVTSLCRFWLLEDAGYYHLLRFFRSKAYVYGALLTAWQGCGTRQEKSVKVAGRAILLGDHTAAVRDGRKMPGVVSMHESSETQSKPGYFRAQCWGGIGILIGSLFGCFCCPLQLQIHQGWTLLGLTESIRVMTLTLLWKPIADHVLLILAVNSTGPIILMSSDLILSAKNAVELKTNGSKTNGSNLV